MNITRHTTKAKKALAKKMQKITKTYDEKKEEITEEIYQKVKAGENCWYCSQPLESCGCGVTDNFREPEFGEQNER